MNKTQVDVMKTQVDVIVVGAGPIGLSMCQALSGSNLTVALIEKQPLAAVAKPLLDGREIAITHRTKAIMQDLHQWQVIDKSDIHFLRRAKVYNGHSRFALGFEKPNTMHGKPIETLGYLISNYIIRQAAFDVLADELNKQDKLKPFFGRRICSAQSFDGYSKVVLDDGSQLYGKLIIAADSRLSFMRQLMGIGASMNDFGRTVLVFRTSHTKSNEETAHEGFYYGKTLAVLPLGQYHSSMVVTLPNSKVAAFKAMNKEQLAHEMMTWLDGRLGDMTIVGDVFDYPLVAVHAKRFFAQRFALIGDAAVGMHPVTAHGYNLGMESVELLSRQILTAHQQGEDIGSDNVLSKYHFMHSHKTLAMYHGTNVIVKLYTNETAIGKAVRHSALRLSHGFLPIKKLITNQLTG